MKDKTIKIYPTACTDNLTISVLAHLAILRDFKVEVFKSLTNLKTVVYYLPMERNTGNVLAEWNGRKHLYDFDISTGMTNYKGESYEDFGRECLPFDILCDASLSAPTELRYHCRLMVNPYTNDMMVDAPLAETPDTVTVLHATEKAFATEKDVDAFVWRMFEDEIRHLHCLDELSDLTVAHKIEIERRERIYVPFIHVTFEVDGTFYRWLCTTDFNNIQCYLPHADGGILIKAIPYNIERDEMVVDTNLKYLAECDNPELPTTTQLGLKLML